MDAISRAQVYRWDDLPHDYPMALLERRRIIGERMMISEILLHEGCDVPLHQHANEQFAVVLSGRLRFGVGAEGTAEHQTIEVRAGEVLYLPCNVPHSAIALEETRVLDLFSPPSQSTGIDRK